MSNTIKTKSDNNVKPEANVISLNTKSQINKQNLIKSQQERQSKIKGGFFTFDEHNSVENNYVDYLLSLKDFASKSGSFYQWENWYWKRKGVDDAVGEENWERRTAASFVRQNAPDKVSQKIISSSISVAKDSLPAVPPSPSKDGNTIIPLKGTWLEITPDGTINYKAPDRKVGLTYVLSVNLKPATGSYTPKPLPEKSQFREYIENLVPCPEERKVLQEYTGYTLTPSVEYQKAVMLQGDGGEGKSVYIDVVSGLHERVEVFDVSNTDTRKSLSLADATLLVCPEAGKHKFQLEFFKSIVVGDKVQLRNLYQNEVTSTVSAKCVFSFNQFPIINDKTNGFWRRVLLFKLNSRVAPDKVNTRLASEILKNERDVVLDWALEGLQRLIRQKGFTKVASLEANVTDWKLAQNTTAQFLDEVEFELHPTRFMLKTELHSMYRKFCLDKGSMPVSNEVFYADIRRVHKDLVEKKIKHENNRVRAVFCRLAAIELTPT